MIKLTWKDVVSIYKEPHRVENGDRNPRELTSATTKGHIHRAGLRGGRNKAHTLPVVRLKSSVSKHGAMIACLNMCGNQVSSKVGICRACRRVGALRKKRMEAKIRRKNRKT